MEITLMEKKTVKENIPGQMEAATTETGKII